jgi:lysine-specific demethylase/histidyl-hydroxylase NO66
MTERNGGRATTGKALRRCVGNVTEFLEHHWSRAPLHRAGADGGGFADLLGIADVDDLVSSSSLRIPAFRLVKDGRPLDPAAYTKPGRVGGRPLRDLGDPGRIYAHFHAGATIVLQSLHRNWLPVTRFCRELELELTHPVQANAYVTPRTARGLGVHADGHDVFVLQFSGRKHWEVFAPADHGGTGARLLDVELTPGDALYVPRGFPHAARTADTASAHLTVGVLSYRWGEVLRDAVTGVLDALEEPLPARFADDPRALAPLVAEQLAEVRRRLDKLDPAWIAAAAGRRFWASRPAILTGQLEQLLSLDRLDDRSLLRRRPGAVCQVTVEGERLVALLGDRELAMPARLGPPLRRILDGGPFAIGDLADHLDEAGRLVLVRRLVREGLLELVVA